MATRQVHVCGTERSSFRYQILQPWLLWHQLPIAIRRKMSIVVANPPGRKISVLVDEIESFVRWHVITSAGFSSPPFKKSYNIYWRHSDDGFTTIAR